MTHINVMLKSSAWRMGWRDYWVGYGSADCPFTANADKRAGWIAGWYTAKARDGGTVVSLPSSPAARGLDL